MKKKWVRNAVILLLVTLLLGGLALTASGSSQVYLLSVNDTVMEMTAENMPIISGNQLYIPYTMLSSQVTGINLGVRAQYNTSRGTLVVTDGVKTVTFDVRNNGVYTSTGETLSARAVVRNSMVFLPVSWLCGYFTGLRCTLNYTAYGVLVRLTNSAVVLSDAQFIDAADSLLQQNYREYQNSIAALSSPSPSISPSPSPSPSLQPDPEPLPLVYLSFRWGSRASEVADLLAKNGQYALFLFECGDLVQQDDLVRRLIGQGHQVGLILTGGDAEQCLKQMRYGQQLMADISCSLTLICSADEVGQNGREVLKEAGCAIWSATLEGNGMSRYELLDGLNSSEPNYVELTCDEEGLELLKNILPALSGSSYRLRQVFAPLL